MDACSSRVRHGSRGLARAVPARLRALSRTPSYPLPLCAWAALIWLAASGCAKHAAIPLYPDAAVTGENGGSTDSPVPSYVTPSGPDTTPFVDPVASFQGRRGSGVVFGGYASDAVAQVFTVSRGSKLVGIDLYVTSCPPESPPREFQWVLCDATSLAPDGPGIPSLPVLARGTAYSVESKFPYDAPPCRIELVSPVQVRPGQALLLETWPMTEEPIVWNGGFGAVSGTTYWCRDGSWSRVRGAPTRDLGRVVWMASG